MPSRWEIDKFLVLKGLMYCLWAVLGFQFLKSWKNQKPSFILVLIGLVCFIAMDTAFQIKLERTSHLSSSDWVLTRVLLTIGTGWLKWSLVEFAILSDSFRDEYFGLGRMLDRVFGASGDAC